VAKSQSNPEKMGSVLIWILALCCLVIGGGQTVSAETPSLWVCGGREVINEPKPSFVKSVVNVSIGNQTESIQKRFSSGNGFKLLFRQDGGRLQKLRVSYRVSRDKRQVVERFPVHIVRIFRNIFEPVDFSVKNRDFNEPRRSIPGAFKRKRDYVFLICAYNEFLQIPRSDLWYKSDYGRILDRIRNYPSTLRVSTGGDLHRYTTEKKNGENGYNEGRKSIKFVNQAARFIGGLICLALMFVFAWYALEGLLQYYGLTRVLRAFGFFALEILSLGGLIWFGLAPCWLGLICDPEEYPANENDPRHIEKIVPQKDLTNNAYWGTVIHMANVLNADKQIAVIGALAEGSSIRSIERITGVHRDTIMRLGVKVGQGCAKVLDTTMRNLPCNRLEMDEIWGFVGKKERNVREGDDAVGSVWTFCAIDAETKLVPAFKVGDRSVATATAFVQDVAERMAYRVQISTDGLNAYVAAMENAFGGNVDYAQIIKTYGHDEVTNNRRYSSPEFVSSEKKVVVGNPDQRLISTSYIERLNATTRLHMRRLTRLTLAFSKKRENFEAAVALHFAYYNFVKRHSTIRCTPAMAAGVTSSFWSVGELLEAAA
jgi:IS1 family transposase